jgi:lysozyme
MMKLSKVGADLIKKYEGCRLKAYKCPAGVWTIGFGHTGNVIEGQVITQAQADALFDKDVQKFVDGVNKLVKVEINQNQFDALVSFAYNLGIGALKKSTLLQYVNKKQFDKAANEFDRWNKADGKVLKGLVNRRNSEEALFEEEALFVTPVKIEPDLNLIREIKRKALAGKKLVSPTPETIKIYECYAPYPK